MQTTNTNNITKKQHIGWIMLLYLLGLFVGSLNMGIITPVRPIIQTSLGVDASTGIWMINIFTLMYAAVIPVSGKLADRHGRKIVFILSIALFGLGSFMCGLSNFSNSFTLMLAGRVVQGLGAGGIMPIATAEFGTSFPEEKRGMALGLVGAAYGIGSVLGATAGSAIVNIFGADSWQWVFYMNLPFCLFIIIFGLIYIPNHKAEVTTKIDKFGTLIMVTIIICLLYGLKNIDFFNFIESIQQPEAWAFLLVAFALIFLFVFVEKKAEDPIFHIEYLSNKQLVITLIISVLSGMTMMGMVFLPQFAENALMMSAGSGGFFILILGIFAGLVSPMSGVLIDKTSEKLVMMIGLAISLIGSLYLAFIATQWPNLPNVIVSLVLIGLGLGFTMGTPLNYMMMNNTPVEESNSALATLSLVRSIGTAIAPAIMVGFIIQAAAGLQAPLMQTMPQMPATAMEQSGQMSGMSSMSSSGLPEELLTKLQNSDVTTIVDVMDDFCDWMFNAMPSSASEQISTMYKAQLHENADQIQLVYQQQINEGYKNMFILVAVLSGISMLLLAFYKTPKRSK